MNGYLKIKTKIDNKDIDKDIKKLEDKIKKIQEDNANSNNKQKELQTEINKYEQMHKEAEKYSKQLDELKEKRKQLFTENGTLPSSQLPNFNKMSSKIDFNETEYEKITAELDKQAPKIDKIYQKLEKVKEKQSENNSKIEEYKQKIEQVKIDKMQLGMKNVGNEITKNIGKLGKMAIAVFGIRSAYSAVKSLMSSMSSYDAQMSSNLEYIKYAITNVFAPVLKQIVQWCYTLLQYLNLIANAWFGINIFGKASVKNWKAMKESANSTAKSAKEISKSLQGFDEMNIQQDNSTNSVSSAKSAGIALPTTDLSGLQIQIPAWLQWIIDNKDIILDFFIGLGIALGLLKLADIAKNLGLIEKGITKLQALGIGIMIYGIIELVKSFIDYLNDPSYENFGRIITNLGIILLGLAAIIGSLPLAIAAVIVIIVGLIAKNWENIKNILYSAVDWIDSKIDWIRDNFGALGVWIAEIFKGAIKIVINVFDGLFKGVKGILDGIINIFKGNFKTGIIQILKRNSKFCYWYSKWINRRNKCNCLSN